MQQENIISVKETRKLLGKDSAELTDSQIRELIALLTLLAKSDLRKAGSNNTVGVNGKA